jgi:hypothetical protein
VSGRSEVDIEKGLICWEKFLSEVSGGVKYLLLFFIINTDELQVLAIFARTRFLLTAKGTKFGGLFSGNDGEF